VDVHEHDFWRKPGGTLECACGFSKRPLAKVAVELPQAWVFEDVALFVVAPVFKLVHSLIEIGNDALAEAFLDLRLDASVAHSSAASTVWVDPAYVAAERWPDSAVSKSAVDGWVRLWRIDLEAIAPAATVGGESA